MVTDRQESGKQNLIKMKLKSVEVALAIQSITELRGVTMLPKWESSSDGIVAEKMMNIEIIVSLC